MNSDLVPECEENYFGCDEKCIPKQSVCNVYEICDDGTDELGCPGESIFIVFVNHHCAIHKMRTLHE